MAPFDFAPQLSQMTPLEPHVVPGPSGFDVALIQAQLVCLLVSLALVLATMYRGSAFHDDGWHLVRAFALPARGAVRSCAPRPLNGAPPTNSAHLTPTCRHPHQPMIFALTFSTYLKLQGLTKSATKDAR